MLVEHFVALWFIVRGDLFYVLPCVIFLLVFFSPFSIAITSLGEERANLSAFRTFVRFVLVWICRFPLPIGVWEGLRFVIVALSGLFSYLFYLYHFSSLSGYINNYVLWCIAVASFHEIIHPFNLLHFIFCFLYQVTSRLIQAYLVVLLL